MTSMWLECPFHSPYCEETGMPESPNFLKNVRSVVCGKPSHSGRRPCTTVGHKNRGLRGFCDNSKSRITKKAGKYRLQIGVATYIIFIRMAKRLKNSLFTISVQLYEIDERFKRYVHCTRMSFN